MQNETPAPKMYTEKQLVDFGNYLLSQKRNDSILEGHNDYDEFIAAVAVVHQEDIDNALNPTESDASKGTI